MAERFIVLNNSLNARHKCLLPFILFLFAVAIRIPYLLNTSEMFDEFAVAGYGRVYIGGLSNLDFSKKFWSINYEHPPVGKYIYGAGVFIEENLPFIQETFDSNYHPDKRYFLARFISVLIGSLNVVLIYLLGRDLFTKRVGVFAALLLSLLPHFIAHNTIAGLETPQAFFATALVYFYLKGIKPVNRKYLFASFMSFALLFATKFSGVFYLFFYLGTLMVLLGRKSLSKRIVQLHISGAVIFYITFFLLWPWLWSNPLNIFESFGYFRNAHSGEYFMGSLGQPGWYYYFAYFFATTPPVIFALFLFPILFRKRKRSRHIWILYIWFLVPFTASFLGLKQDGVRYVFSYMPALALISGVGLDSLLERIRGGIHRWIVISVVFISIAIPLLQFFPYYLDYYNSFFGGVEGVYKRKTFDYSWWGEGISQGVNYVNNNYESTSVYPFLRPAHAASQFKDGLEIYKSFDPLNKPAVILMSEYFVYYNYDLSFLDSYDMVRIIGIQDTPLIRIYELKK